MAHAQAAETVQDRGYDSIIAEAVSEYDAGHWEEARALFFRAHEQKPNARTERGLGIVEFELRHYVAADRFLRQALADERIALSEQQKQEANEILGRIQDFLGRYRVENDSASLLVLVDGAPFQPEADGSLLLEAGEHVLTFRAPQQTEREQRLDVHGGERETLKVALPPIATAASAAPGVSEPKAPTHAASHSASVWPWVVVGTSSAAAIAGSVLLAFGLHDASKVENAKDGTKWSALESAQSSAPVLTGTGVVLLGAGVVGAAIGVVWLMHGQDNEHRVALRVSPTSLNLRGEF